MAALMLATLAACESRADKEAKVLAQANADLARSDSIAHTPAAAPSDGLWNEANLTDRLRRTGVAPRRVLDAPPGPAFVPVERILILAGGGEVHAFIFPDSIAREAVTSRLDPFSATPRGERVPFELPITLVVHNNLMVVISGGSPTNHDRIATAISGGLPVSTP